MMKTSCENTNEVPQLKHEIESLKKQLASVEKQLKNDEFTTGKQVNDLKKQLTELSSQTDRASKFLNVFSDVWLHGKVDRSTLAQVNSTAPYSSLSSRVYNQLRQHRELIIVAVAAAVAISFLPLFKF
ncbi:hypothetical protein Ciccas_012174 [Cichlidogyrus casuarinus]|uniref:Uncharacterized protein n=1 Tax=Cichlidogyrus casuarinus TaxID=1844966 RepID=A0ABD2PQ30_9PLAT